MRRKSFLLIGLLFAFCIMIPVCASAATTVGPVTPPTVTLNQQFDVDITINGNTTNVEAMDFKLEYDNAKLQVMDYKIGNFLGQSLVPALSGSDKTTSINWANTYGIVGAGLQGLNSSSSGNVLTINFKAIDTGSAYLNVTTSSLKPNNLNSVVAATPLSTSVTINEAASVIGDFNKDGTVDFEDFIIFTFAYDKKAGDTGWDQYVPEYTESPYKRCDIGPVQGTYPDIVINPDGIVDFEDFFIFCDAYVWSNS